MPLYFATPLVTLTTLPTGRIEGSDAAIPVRTVAPEVVVVPLQYAVAVKSRCAPAVGAVGSRICARRGVVLRESKMLTSYASIRPTTAVKVTASLRQRDREMTRCMSGPEMLVAASQF